MINIENYNRIRAVSFPVSGGIITVIMIMAIMLMSVSWTHAQDVIRASGGTGISIDNIDTGTFTSLSGPTIRETAGGQLGVGQTIVLELPTGYEWNGDLTAEDITVTITPVGAQNTRLAVAFNSATTDQVTFTVTASSVSSGAGQGPGRMMIEGLQLIPTSDEVPNTGHITNTGTVSTNETNYGNLSTAVGAMNQVRVETAADGNGQIVGAQNILAGNSLTVYSISRDAGDNFRENIALDIEEDWSLIEISGGISQSDLTPASNRRSALFSSTSTGSARIRAHFDDVDLVPSGVITVLPRPASQMIIQTQPSSGTVAGEPFSVQPVIHLLDQFGNLVTTDNDTEVTVSIESGDGELSGELTQTASGGIIAFDETAADSLWLNKAGTVTLRFESPAAGTVISGPVNVTAADPHRLIFTAVPSSGTVNINLTPSVRVQLLDEFTNNVPASGVTVSLELVGGSGDLNASPAETGSNGEAVFADVQFDEPGSKTIRATSDDLLPETSSVITILTDEEVSGFSIVAPDSSAIDTVTAGLPFDIKIAAINGAGNLIDTFNDKVVISSTSAISDGGGETGEFTDGILELHSVTLTGSGDHTLTAQLPEDASVSGTTDPFVVLPGGVHFPNGVVTSDPDEIIADGSSEAQITVQLRDEFGNDLVTGGETVVLSTDRGSLSTNSESNQSEVIAMDQEDGSYTATLTSISEVETATIRAIHDETEFAQVEVPFVPGNVTSFLVTVPQDNGGTTGNPAVQTAGVSFPVTVTAVDAAGNHVSGYATTLSFTTTSLFYDEYTDDFFQELEGEMEDGKLVDFEPVLSQTGNTVTISVADENQFSVTGTSESFQVTAGEPDTETSTLTVTPSVLQNAESNVSVISVILRDRFSNRNFTDFSNMLDVKATQIEPADPEPFELPESRLGGTTFLPGQWVYRDTLFATDTIELVEISALLDDTPLSQTANVNIVVPNTWQPTGSPSQRVNWNRDGNWSLGTVPTSSSFVIIPGGLSDYPDLDLNIEVANLEIQDDGQLILFGGRTIEISGSIQVDGSLNIEDNTELFIGGNFTGSGFFEAGESVDVTVAGNINFDFFFARTDGSTVTFNGEIRQDVTTASFFVQEMIISNDVLITDADVVDTDKVVVESGQVFELDPDAGITLIIESQFEGAGSFVLNNNTLVLMGNTEIASIDAGDGMVIFGVQPPTEEEPEEDFAGLSRQQITNLSEMKAAIVNNPEGVRTFENIIIDSTLSLRNGPLIISSGRSLIASEIIYPEPEDESLTGTLQFRRSINNVRGWRMMSAPVRSTIADLTDGLVVQGMSGSVWPDRQPNFLYYDETDGDTDFNRWRVPGSVDSELDPGKGYFFYVFGNPEDEDYNDNLPVTLTMSGREHHPEGEMLEMNVTMTVPENSNDDFIDGVEIADHGWNLVGNPFGATIDWDDDENGNWIKDNIDNVIYIWKPEVKGDTLVTGQYHIWNGDTGSLGNGLITPYQAFWVKANDENPDLQIHPDVKTTGGQFRQKRVKDTDSYRLVLRLEAGGLETTTYFSFNENARVGLDYKDAFLLEPMADSYLKFYSVPVGGEVPLAINNLPRRSEETFEIPVGIGGYLNGRPVHGDYTMHVDPESNIPENWSVKLRNNITGKTTDLQSSSKITTYIEAFRGQQEQVSDPMHSQPSRLEPRLINIRPDSINKSTESGEKESETASNGSKDYTFTLFLTPDALRDEDVPHTVFLNQNYPNPFNPDTRIVFGLPSDGAIRLEVYDILGRRVQTLANGQYEAGVHSVRFDGSRLASGVYLYRLRTADRVITRKMMLIK